MVSQAFLDLKEAMERGDFDNDNFEDLRWLITVGERRAKRAKANRAAAEVKPGAKIRITMLKPKAFIGSRATFERWEGDRAVVTLDELDFAFIDRHWLRYTRAGRVMNLPKGTFEVIG